MTASRSDHAPLAAGGEPPLIGNGQLVDLLLDMAVYVKSMGEAVLADTPLSLLSIRMLAAVLAEPGITVSEMSRRIPKTQQAISQVAAQLTELGLIERRLGSGRGIELYVTKAGEKKAQDGLRRERELRLRLRELLGDERHEQLERLLRESREILREAR
jgi:DNA-binding MarR family transcriptional regulator